MWNRDRVFQGRQILTILLVLLFMVAGTAVAVESPEKTALTHARIDWYQVAAPFGRFLLIRKGTNTCAIRFSEFHPGNNAKPPTLFCSGDESHHAEYDWYWQADGSGDFSKSNVRSGHNKLIQRPLHGIGRFAFQTGTVHVRCGPFRLLWQYPMSVSFDAKGGCGDGETDLAPTRWQTLADISIKDSRLKWYKCDPHRRTLLISVDDL